MVAILRLDSIRYRRSDLLAVPRGIEDDDLGMGVVLCGARPDDNPECLEVVPLSPDELSELSRAGRDENPADAVLGAADRDCDQVRRVDERPGDAARQFEKCLFHAHLQVIHAAS